MSNLGKKSIKIQTEHWLPKHGVCILVCFFLGAKEDDVTVDGATGDASSLNTIKMVTDGFYYRRLPGRPELFALRFNITTPSFWPSRTACTNMQVTCFDRRSVRGDTSQSRLKQLPSVRMVTTSVDWNLAVIFFSMASTLVPSCHFVKSSGGKRNKTPE